LNLNGTTRLVLVALTCGAACAHGMVDRSKGYGGKPTTVEIGEVPVKGFDVKIGYGDQVVEGELLGLDPAYVYILVEGQTVAVLRSQVKNVNVRLYESHSTAAGVWTAIGTVSTVTHGFWAVFSAPVWLATGIPTTVAMSNRSHMELENDQLGPLAQFARFPQGLPPNWPGNRGVSRDEVQRRVQAVDERYKTSEDGGPGDAGPDAPRAAEPGDAAHATDASGS
jgi:hypothetical protein